MGVGVLGPLVVDGGTIRLGSRDRTVLAALAMRSGEVRTADQLADAVWGEHPPASSGKNLQSCVSRLRKHLGRESIETSTQGYRLMLPPDAVDAWWFEQLLARARELLTLREPERARFTVDQALALWRGRPLAELEDWEPGAVEATRLSELRLDAEEIRLDAALQAGHHREVLVEAQSMVQEAPLRERRWSLLALAQYQSGRQAEALRTLHRLRKLLAEELGLDPAPDVLALEQAILRQEPSLLVEASSPAASDTCPYLGLAPYDEADAESFFGREVELRRCLHRLAEHGVLAVVGPSGSGKSSLVRAGVVVALRREGRVVRVVTPGRHPMDVLDDTGSGSRRPVLVVDQAEEVFSVCEDAEERQRFLDAVAAYALETPVVLALRADRTGDVTAHPGLARILEQGLFLLGAMSPDSLRSAVEEPARRAGLVVEPGLTDLLVREVEGEPGALPLLSHALRETWLRREGRTLSVAGYQASGGIRGAVAQSAEQVYGEVAEAERNLLKELMLRLVAPGAEGEPVRSRLPRRNVVADPVQDGLIDRLARARLVTLDDDVVEIAHESLFRAWPRLRGWLDDDVAGRRILHHLVASADAWDSLGRPDSELYRGVRLTNALTWRDSGHPELTQVERDFLAASQDAAAAEERSAVERARQQSRMISRLRITLAGAGVLLVLALVAGFVAVQQTRNAEDSATSADARRVSTLALVTDDIDKALLLAVAGYRLADTPETRSSVLAVLAKTPALVRSIQMEGSPVTRLDVSFDGRSVATVDTEHGVRLYETGTGELGAEFQAGPDIPLSGRSGDVAFSPDGQTLAVDMAAPARQPVMLLDAGTLKPLSTLPGGFGGRRWATQDLGFSEDGRFFAATMYRVVGEEAATRMGSGRALVWNLSAPQQPVRVIRLKVGGAESLALSPDGALLYVTDPLAAYEVTTGERARIRTPELVYQLALSPDGGVLAGTTTEGSTVLIDTSTKEVRDLVGASNPFLVRFSPDGSQVAVISDSPLEAVVWDVTTRKVVTRLPLGSKGDALAFAPDGAAASTTRGKASTLFTAGDDAALRRWDLTGSHSFVPQVVSARPNEGQNIWTSVAPGGAYIAHQTDRVWFRDTGSDQLTRRTDSPGASSVRGSWHPDGLNFALANNHMVTLWEAFSGQVVVGRRWPGGELTGLDYSTDGSRLVVTDASSARVLDAETLSPEGDWLPLGSVPCAVSLGPDNRTALVLTGPPERLWDFWSPPCTGWALVDLVSGVVVRDGQLPVAASRLVDFSPDGMHAAISGAAGEIMVLDTRTGEPVRVPAPGHAGGVLSLSYSADGRHLLSSGWDSTAALWDGATGLLDSRLVIPESAVIAGFQFGEKSVLVADAFGGPAYRWDTSAASAADFACQAAGRDLTEQEWQDVFGDRPYEETCPGY